MTTLEIEAKDFYFPTDEILILGGSATKYRQNVAAIKIVKQCQAENRPPTEQEQYDLSLYTGWGDSSVLKYFLQESAEMKRLLTPAEYDSIKASSLNAHYTATKIIGVIWEAMVHLGIGNRAHLRALDPSAGIGHFKSMTPAHLRDQIEWTEIELDSMTAQILALLHPESKVFADGYEKVELPKEWFDIAISNVPFGDYGVYATDVPSYARRRIHDFFFAKSMNHLNTGGIMAFITSRYTLDKMDEEVRAYLAEWLDFLGAVRLPDNAFEKNAGTQVVTDVLFFQKRAAKCIEQPDWVTSTKVMIVDDYKQRFMPINTYYQKNPQMIAGKPSLTGSMYEDDAYTIRSNSEDLAAQVSEILIRALPANVIAYKTEAEKPSGEALIVTDAAKARTPQDQIKVDAMQDIYRAAKLLLGKEIEGASEAEITALRVDLNRVYDKFRNIHGPLGQINHVRLMRGSIEGPFLRALENHHPVLHTFAKAGIFFGATVRSQATLGEAPTPADALTISLDRYGRVDMDAIAEMASMTREQAILNLGPVIFQLPGTDEWETKDAYLSGNVREKMRKAKAAVQYDFSYQRNVEALEAVIPEYLKPSDIRAALGSSWIPTGDVAEFCNFLLKSNSFKVTYMQAVATWEVSCTYFGGIPEPLLRSKWGTPRVNAVELIKDSLNMRMTTVWDDIAEDKRVINATETTAAQAKQTEIKEAFEVWIWSDSDRAARLAELYNEKFNAFVTREYNGDHLTMPGLNLNIQLRPAQKNLIWRILQSYTVLGAHEVGMGKTLAGIIAIMEGKRLGLIKKAMVTVPNHLVGQWRAAILWAYPNANVLVTTTQDLSKGNRGAFLSRIATNEWDIVLVAESTFKLLPVKGSTMANFYQKEISILVSYLRELNDDKRENARVIKMIEKSKKNFEIKLMNCAAMDKDAEGTITFEEMGIDLLMGDEFQEWKKLFFATKITRIAGISSKGSDRAFDMYVKSKYVLDHNGKFVGLTGTPITNSIAEMFTMLRYFAAHLLEEQGLSHFDAWANQYAQAVSELEATPDGGLRSVVRFRYFYNMPELMAMWRQVTDTARVGPESKITRPNLFSGGPIKVLNDGGNELRAFTDTLADRAEKIRGGQVDKHIDNMLKVCNDGRKAALDMSLVRPGGKNDLMVKIDSGCKLITRIWKESAAVKGTQLIFIDLATPKDKKSVAAKVKDAVETEVDEEDTAEEMALTEDMYRIVRERLGREGIPAEEIAFIHTAKTDEQKNKLFAQVNAGTIRILIGSCSKMGTGMNVQERLLAIHLFTPPWRPADIEQELGRMLRSGNKYKSVYYFIHVTIDSFESFIWQLLETKAYFIEQIANGSVTAREIEDIGVVTLSYKQIKALASGSQKMMEKLTLETEIARLNAVYTSWRNSQRRMKNDLAYNETRLEKQLEIAAEYATAIEAVAPYRAQKFTIDLMTDLVDGEMATITDRETAGKRLRALALAVASMGQVHGGRVIARYKGQTLYARMVNVIGNKEKIPQIYVGMKPYDLIVSVADSDAGITMSLDAQIANLVSGHKKTLIDIEELGRDIKSASEELLIPWANIDKLVALQAQLKVVDTELSAEKQKAAEKKEEAEAEAEVFVDPLASDEVQAALESIRMMHADSFLMENFYQAVVEEEAEMEEELPVETSIAIELPLFAAKPICVCTEVVEIAPTLGDKDQMMLFAFEDLGDQVGQLDMWGGFTPVSKAKKGKKR